jgi:hypothetical protein
MQLLHGEPSRVILVLRPEHALLTLRIALVVTHKGNMSFTEYVNRMRVLGDEMASTGKPLDDEEMVSYILAGPNIEYNQVVSAVLACIELISVNEL